MKGLYQMKNEIVANNLTAGYGQGFHFENLNLIIPSGKITSLIGANGSGKSTILKTMSRLIQPTHGEVYIDGKSIFHMNTREVAKKLAILPQSATAPEGISVEELVANGRFPHISGMRRLSVEDREIVHWAMEACNIEELSKREVDTLSGGQKQRAWIAMALAQKTDILFLDEPTTYLDISHQLDILQLLQKLNQTQKVTIVMVLHDLNHASMFSHHVVAINNGEKLIEGTPAEIITEENLRCIFHVMATILVHPSLGYTMCIPYAFDRDTND